MNTNQTSQFCPYCGKYVLATRPAANHVLHAIITMATCVLWMPVWLIVTVVNSMGGYSCTVCGGATQPYPNMGNKQR